MGSLWSSIDSVVAGKFIKTGELSKEDTDRFLPPVYKVEIIGEIPDTEKHSTLTCLPPPNGAINSQVYLSSVIENNKLTAVDHF